MTALGGPAATTTHLVLEQFQQLLPVLVQLQMQCGSRQRTAGMDGLHQLPQPLELIHGHRMLFALCGQTGILPFSAEGSSKQRMLQIKTGDLCCFSRWTATRDFDIQTKCLPLLCFPFCTV